jgi:hypothetical protein
VRKRSTWVAWFMLAIFVVSVIVMGALMVANGSFQREPLADTVALLLAFTAFMVVGALIVAHRPGNAIGWIFSAAGLLAVTGALAEEYADYAYLTRPGSLPGAIGGLVLLVGVVPDGVSGAAVHAVVLPHRSVAVAPVAACCLAGAGQRWRRSRRWPPSSPRLGWKRAAWSPTRSGSPGCRTRRRAWSVWSWGSRSCAIGCTTSIG